MRSRDRLLREVQRRRRLPPRLLDGLHGAARDAAAPGLVPPLGADRETAVAENAVKIAMIGPKGIPATDGGVDRHVEELLQAYQEVAAKR